MYIAVKSRVRHCGFRRAEAGTRGLPGSLYEIVPAGLYMPFDCAGRSPGIELRWFTDSKMEDHRLDLHCGMCSNLLPFPKVEPQSEHTPFGTNLSCVQVDNSRAPEQSEGIISQYKDPLRAHRFTDSPTHRFTHSPIVLGLI